MADATHKGIRHALRVFLLITPAWVAAFVLIRGFDRFVERFVVELTIAETATAIGFAVGYGGIALEAMVYRQRNLTPPRRTTGHGLLLAALSLPFGVIGGLRLASWLFDFPFTFGANVTYGVAIGASALLLFAFVETRARLRMAVGQMRLQDAELSRTRLEAQVSVLTAQMNPHLLFNALNASAELVHSDPDNAEAMLLNLADLYRSVLEACHTNTHSLAAELELCRLYIEVQKARFGERLAYKTSIPDTLDIRAIAVPPLLLQPLVENAVVHGVAPRRRGGKIEVSVRERDTSLVIEVLNDGEGLEGSTPSGSGTALHNLRARLSLLYGDEGHVQLEQRSDGVSAQVALPSRAVSFACAS